MRFMTSGGRRVVMVVWSTAPLWMRNTSFAAALPVEAAPVAVEAAEANVTSEDVVNRHLALEKDNEISPCAATSFVAARRSSSCRWCWC